MTRALCKGDPPSGSIRSMDGAPGMMTRIRSGMSRDVDSCGDPCCAPICSPGPERPWVVRRRVAAPGDSWWTMPRGSLLRRSVQAIPGRQFRSPANLSADPECAQPKDRKDEGAERGWDFGMDGDQHCYRHNGTQDLRSSIRILLQRADLSPIVCLFQMAHVMGSLDLFFLEVQGRDRR